VTRLQASYTGSNFGNSRVPLKGEWWIDFSEKCQSGSDRWHLDRRRRKNIRRQGSSTVCQRVEDNAFHLGNLTRAASIYSEMVGSLLNSQG
jgi:hypothetical protein